MLAVYVHVFVCAVCVCVCVYESLLIQSSGGPVWWAGKDANMGTLIFTNSWQSATGNVSHTHISGKGWVGRKNN